MTEPSPNHHGTRSKSLGIHRHSSNRSTKLGYFMLFLGFFACPCYLLLTLPLILAMVGSIGLVVSITTNEFPFIMMTFFVIFLPFLAIGFILIRRGKIKEEASCPKCQVARTKH